MCLCLRGGGSWLVGVIFEVVVVGETAKSCGDESSRSPSTDTTRRPLACCCSPLRVVAAVASGDDLSWLTGCCSSRVNAVCVVDEFSLLRRANRAAAATKSGVVVVVAVEVVVGPVDAVVLIGVVDGKTVVAELRKSSTCCWYFCARF